MSKNSGTRSSRSLPPTTSSNVVPSSSVGTSSSRGNSDESVILNRMLEGVGGTSSVHIQLLLPRSGHVEDSSEQLSVYAGNEILNRPARKALSCTALQMREPGGQTSVESSTEDPQGPSFYPSTHDFKGPSVCSLTHDLKEPSVYSSTHHLKEPSVYHHKLKKHDIEPQPQERTSRDIKEPPHCSTRRKVYEALEEKSGGLAPVDLAKNSSGRQRQQQPLIEEPEKVAAKNNVVQKAKDDVPAKVPRATLGKLKARIEFPRRVPKFSTSSGIFFSDAHALYSYYGPKDRLPMENPSIGRSSPIPEPPLPTQPADVTEQAPATTRSVRDFYEFLNSPECKKIHIDLAKVKEESPDKSVSGMSSDELSRTYEQKSSSKWSRECKLIPLQWKSNNSSTDTTISSLESRDMPSDELSRTYEQKSSIKRSRECKLIPLQWKSNNSSTDTTISSLESCDMPSDKLSGTYEQKSLTKPSRESKVPFFDWKSNNSSASTVNWGSASSSMLYASSLVPPKPGSRPPDLGPERSFLDYGFSAYGSRGESKRMQARKTRILECEDLESKLVQNLTVIIGSSRFECSGLAFNCYTDFFMKTHHTDFLVSLPPEMIEPRVFVTIYEWMMMDNPQVKRKGLVQLYMAATYLGIEELKAQCISCFDNYEVFREAAAFMLYKEASFYKVEDLQQSMLGRVQCFFYTLVASRDFCELDFATVEALLTSNYVGVNHEGEILLAGVRWLNFDWEHRRIYADQIMSCTRFLLLPPRQLLEISVQQERHEVLRTLESDAMKREIMKGLTFNYNLRQDNPQEYAQSLQDFKIELPPQRFRVYDERCPEHYKPTDVPIEPLKYPTFMEFLEYVRREGTHHWKSLKELSGDVLTF